MLMFGPIFVNLRYSTVAKYIYIKHISLNFYLMLLRLKLTLTIFYFSSGLFCENPPPMVLLQTSPCDYYECQNGAQCIVVQQEPVCRCLAGFAGQKCEKLITVNFVGKDSYVELPPAKIRPQANISLQVSYSDNFINLSQPSFCEQIMQRSMKPLHSFPECNPNK